ncbi:CHAT domain-containing protein [Marivirga sp. S37H4]|uniref:CHAT domain-containing protein n=1 Tax=Marivirga aurantiaca TaxID=2802615 RepID=A0A935CC24_9BACT|nr:CHAT domain-containing protein [Marivirga aurantiaca]MBK6267429.1 CHAT domain-containing protein [Marivirga aurantiaca]
MNIGKFFLTVIIGVLFSIGQDVSAQNVKKFNKYLEKAEKKFEKTNYEKALKFSRKLEEKSTKKLGKENQFVAVAKLKQAKYNWALGDYTEFYELHNDALAISEKTNGAKSLGHAINLQNAAKNMINYGNYFKANKYLEEAYAIFSTSEEADNLYLADLQLLQAEIATALGNYNQALSLLQKHESFYLQRTLEKNGEKFSKKEKQIRHEDVARLITLKSNTLRHRGEFLRSDSAFVYGENWIKDKLGKRSKYFSNHLYYFAQMLEENGTNELPASYYKDAYIYSISSLGATHPHTLRNLEKLAINAIHENNSSKASAYFTELQKIVKKNFNKSSTHFVRLATISFEADLRKGKTRKIEESVIKIMNDKKLLPKDHPINIDLYNIMIKVAGSENNYSNIENYLTEIIKIKNQLYGDSSIRAGLSRIDLAHFWVDYSDKFNQAMEVYNSEFYGKVEKEISSGHTMYVNLLNHLATAYQYNDSYAKASELLDEALLLTRVKYDNQDIDFGKELTLIADLQIKIGEYEKADANIVEALSILENFDNDLNVIYYIKALETQAKLLTIKGFYDEAEDALELSQKLFKSAIPNAEYNPISAQQELAAVYLKIGKYTDTEKILKTALIQNTRQYGKESQKLIAPMVDYGRLQLIRGDYPKAEEYARKALHISESQFSKYSTKNTPATLLLAELNESLGDYDKAEEYYSQAINILENQFGRTHVDVATAISRLAIVKFQNNSGSAAEIEKMLFEAKEIIGNRFSTNSPLYADLLKDMANFFISQNKLEDAFSFLTQSEDIWKKKVGRRNNIKAADIHILRGDIFYKQKKYRDAEKEYKSSQKLNEKFFNDKHPEYVKATARLSKVYYMDGNKRKAKSTIEEVIANYDTFIDKYFPALSEREKTKYWNTVKGNYDYYNTMALSLHDSYPEMIEQVYNHALKTKGLLLSNSIKMRERILNSTDSLLRDRYFEWIDKKETLTKSIAMSEEQLAQEGINLSHLSKEVESIEKELSQKSELFNQGFDNQNYTWEQIKNVLQPNEVAIEMVRFRYFDHTLTDSIVYIMLILKNEKDSKPSFVVLNNGKDLESKYFNYYRNSIKYKIPDQYSYKNYWEPIEKEIGKNTTVYLSPDGVYNQINLETIPLEANKYLIDQSNIILVSNTKDLFINKIKSKQIREEKSALLFGDPKFYLASKSEYKDKFRSGATQVNELPGTRKEIEALTKLLQQNGWTTSHYLENNASEPQVKEINSPTVFHIATHGFFNDEQNPESEEFNKGDLSNNPLMKSGLMLQGAGDLLVKTKYNFNIEAGILTAYEAMNLNLDKTDLVVLSACETGVGEVHAGEGVFGLQRSFLVAGAKTLIMSLFKVSDEATEKLMVSFYTKWLETGNKRQAFIDAKKEIRNEYKDPIYWGAFVMIGLD